MTTSSKTDLASLAEGIRFLTGRPLAALGIATLGMALAALAPMLQTRAGLPDDPQVYQALTFACILPLELYFIPRFLIAADAQTGQNPLNRPAEWRQRFEERWLRAFWGKLLLGLAFGVGFLLLFVPGLLVLMAFGWVPLRILLRGESLAQAARGSFQMMGRTWRRALLTVSALAIVYLSVGMLLDFLVGLVLPDPTPQVRMVHPAIWAENFCISLVELWLSASLLALFRRLEAPAEDQGNMSASA